MATGQVSQVIHSLRQAMLRHDGAGLTDGQLLDAFIERREEAAFAALVRRHGPMVWAVCLRVLRNHHDAEDAFQATFLVLVRKATSILPREMVVNWLYGVARQTALKARATISKRRMRERQTAEMPEPAVAGHDLWNDLRLLLDQELSRLPDKYRVAIVLCDLECKPRKEVARQLGLPEGTVASRLATARTMLAKRLARQGLGVCGGSLAAVLSQKATVACVPASAVNSTIGAARGFVVGQAAASGMISAKVAALTDGVLRIMFLKTLKTVAAMALVVGMVTLTTTMVAGGKGDAVGEPAVKAEEKPQAKAGKADPSKDKPGEENAVQNDLEKLQGTWLLVSAEENRRTVPEEKVKKMNLTLTIKDDRFTLKAAGDREMLTLAASGRQMLTLKGHTNRVRSVSWSPDGKLLATGGDDGTAKVWEESSGRVVLTLKGLADPIMSVCWSPDGKRLATASAHTTTDVWEVTSGQLLFSLQDPTGGFWSVSWSADGKRLATGSGTGTIKVWEAASGQQLLALKGHNGLVWSVSWSPDGKRLATVSHDGTARLWDVRSGQELLTIQGHKGPVGAVAVTPDGKRLITGNQDGTARLWDVRSGQELTVREPRTGFWSISWSPDSKRLATGDDDGTTKVWEARSGRELLTLKSHTLAVDSVSWSPDGKLLATGSADGTAKVWEVASGRVLLTLNNGRTNPVWSVSWSPDGKRLATAGNDGTVKVWEVSTGPVLLPLNGPVGSVSSVSFSPDGKQVTTVDADGTVRLWEAAGLTGALRGKLTVDPTKQPKTMEWSALKPEYEKQLNLKGIYAVEGDSLTFCYGEPRPTEFKTKPNRQPNGAPLPNLDQRLFVFKRQER